MAMIADAFVCRFVEMLSTFVNEEVVMLLGVKDELKRLQRRLEKIKNVLEDAERKRVLNRSINCWLNELREVMYDADDVIDCCRIEGEKNYNQLLEQRSSTSAAANKVTCRFPLLSCFNTVAFRHDIGDRIRSINIRLEEIAKERSEFQLTPTLRGGRMSKLIRQTSPVIESSVTGMGIEDDTRKLVKLLIKEDGRRCLSFAIVGMGGIGKTTLAQKVFDEKSIRATFPTRIWICVSRDFTEVNLLKEIMSRLGVDHGEAQTRAQLEPIVKSSINQKKFFLVLDDVWRGQIWEDLLQNSLQNGAQGSRILVTTRDENVARQMGAVKLHRVKQLTDGEGWDLLCKKVFLSGEAEIQGLRGVGMQIVQKCNGLPLAIKTIGGVLRTKEASRREWEKVLRSNAWSLTKLPEGLMGALYLSYEDLPSHLKQCFLYCSIFPEDYVFARPFLVQLWVAEGFVRMEGNLAMEELAEDYYRDLIRRSLLQPEPNSYDDRECKMHDLLRSLAQFLTRDENFSGDLEQLNVTSVKVRRLSMASRGMIKIPDVVKELTSLRTLKLFNNPLAEIYPKDIFRKLCHLRVLDLSGTDLECLPDSVGHLMHLRLLNISCSRITELPESIGGLRNLQYLILQGCKYLQSLPNSIAKLYNLRSLDLLYTHISRTPVGIGALLHLSLLTGFPVDNGRDVKGSLLQCNLEELKPLTRLRILVIEKLERATGKADARAATLWNKSHLNHLVLCSVCDPLYKEEEIIRIEEVFEELCPPPGLELLQILGFFGLRFPNWMSSFHLPNLTRLDLKDCIFCEQLPSLGQLPQLRYLCIFGAFAITTIGPEFFGNSVTGGPSFRRLETLIVKVMPNWEEWWGMEDGSLPCLGKLHIEDCPKLQALPEGLQHATALTELTVIGTHSLRKINYLTSLSNGLFLLNNHSLETISNLPTLQTMIIGGCPSLKHVENLASLERLYMFDYLMKCLPEWFGLQTTPALQEFRLDCSSNLLGRCLMNCPDWPKIQDIPQVYVHAEDILAYLACSSCPFSYETNLINIMWETGVDVVVHDIVEEDTTSDAVFFSATSLDTVYAANSDGRLISVDNNLSV